MNIQRPQSRQPMPEHAKKVFSGILFDVYQWEQEMFDGTTATFEKLTRPDTVVVFPILPDGRILLIDEEQPGLAHIPLDAITGRLEKDEDPEVGARRELKEESGYEAAQLDLWFSYQPTTKLDWAIYIFIARGVEQVSNPELDAGEKITLKPVTFDEFIEIGASEDFPERELRPVFLEAKYDDAKRETLRTLFSN